jgi:hypothetical protein
MTRPYATVAGQAVIALVVHVPSAGVWYADVELEGDAEVAGRVTIALGELELEGTVDAGHTGTFGLQRKLRVVAGGGGWATLLAAKAYHTDNGVQARTVVDDAIREAGEELGATFAPSSVRLAADYVRQTGPASRVLEDAIGSALWWVDYEGRTQVGARSSSTPADGSYEVLEHEPRDRLVTLGVDDLRSIVIGSVLSAGLDEPLTVRELELVVSADTVRVVAWCGGSSSSRDRLGDALGRFVDRRTDSKLFGIWRYRVVRLSGDRLELQVIERATGLPDILPISMWPGVAGVHAEPQLGAEVLVQFIEGRRDKPIVTHFSGKDGVGFVPANVTHDATTLIKLGANATKAVALAEDTKARLDTLQTAHDTHKHPTAATGPASLPDVVVGALAPIGASKVKAE